MKLTILYWFFTDPDKYFYYRVCRNAGSTRESAYKQVKKFG